MSTKKWLLILGIITALALAVCFFLRNQVPGTVAKVYVDGKEVESIRLDLVSASYEIPIETTYGRNIILVEPGKISVKEADCPDKICVETGRIPEAGNVIACLPHRLSIVIASEIESEEVYDGVAK